MFIYFIFFSIIIVFLYLGILVYNKNPQQLDNKLFFLMVFWAVLWFLLNFLENEQGLGSFRGLFLKLDFAFAPILAFFWFLFLFLLFMLFLFYFSWWVGLLFYFLNIED